MIQDKERLYVELKNILARQPGPEVAEQLAVYGENLKAKKRQMKAMRSELLMYKQQVTEYRGNLAQIRESFGLLQEQYFELVRNRNAMRSQGGGSYGVRQEVGSADMSQPLQQGGYRGDGQGDDMRYGPYGTGGVQSITPFYESPAPPTPGLGSSAKDLPGEKEEKTDAEGTD